MQQLLGIVWQKVNSHMLDKMIFGDMENDFNEVQPALSNEYSSQSVLNVEFKIKAKGTPPKSKERRESKDRNQSPKKQKEESKNIKYLNEKKEPAAKQRQSIQNTQRPFSVIAPRVYDMEQAVVSRLVNMI